MAENDLLQFPLAPSANEAFLPPGSALIPLREVNFADPLYTDPQALVDKLFIEPPTGSIFKPNGLARPNNSSLSNAEKSKDYDFSLFNSYVHYLPNPAGGGGLLDTTPFDAKASVIYTRSSTFKSYSPYV